MASPSRILTSQEIAAEQNPSPAANPIRPEPASPPQSDSIDALFSMEEADAVVDSPTSERKKRGREEDSVAGDTPMTQRRRSARNPRVGLGFHNRPEDPIFVNDPADAAKVGGGDGGTDEGVSLVGVQTGSFALIHDGRIVPDSVCTQDTLAKLREEYMIPDNIILSLPHRGFDVYTPPQDRLLIHKAAFECGVRLPLHPTLRRALVALELAPLQISPGFWKHLTGFLVLWKEQCGKDRIEREPGLDELRYLFNITSMVPRGQFYLRANNEMRFIVPGANVKYAAPWKEEWLVVEGEWGRTAFIGGYEYPVPTQFTVRDKWAKGVLAPESREILAKIMKRGYTNMQYPTLDPFEGGRLERYLRISIALPGELIAPCCLAFLYIFSFFCFSLSFFSSCSIGYPDGSGVSFLFGDRGYDSAGPFLPCSISYSGC